MNPDYVYKRPRFEFRAPEKYVATSGELTNDDNWSCTPGVRGERNKLNMGFAHALVLLVLLKATNAEIGDGYKGYRHLSRHFCTHIYADFYFLLISFFTDIL